ncbi:hypothetical protein DFH06DRAFT_1350136 [Mycena polygramma]|nr:hypothetical protein DFH06DRAFT_1350136 [Mycena polygramma]
MTRSWSQVVELASTNSGPDNEAASSGPVMPPADAGDISCSTVEETGLASVLEALKLDASASSACPPEKSPRPPPSSTNPEELAYVLRVGGSGIDGRSCSPESVGSYDSMPDLVSVSNTSSSDGSYDFSQVENHMDNVRSATAKLERLASEVTDKLRDLIAAHPELAEDVGDLQEICGGLKIHCASYLEEHDRSVAGGRRTADTEDEDCPDSDNITCRYTTDEGRTPVRSKAASEYMPGSSYMTLQLSSSMVMPLSRGKKRQLTPDDSDEEADNVNGEWVDVPDEELVGHRMLGDAGEGRRMKVDPPKSTDFPASSARVFGTAGADNVDHCEPVSVASTPPTTHDGLLTDHEWADSLLPAHFDPGEENRASQSLNTPSTMDDLIATFCNYVPASTPISSSYWSDPHNSSSLSNALARPVENPAGSQVADTSMRFCPPALEHIPSHGNTPSKSGCTGSSSAYEASDYAGRDTAASQRPFEPVPNRPNRATPSRQSIRSDSSSSRSRDEQILAPKAWRAPPSYEKTPAAAWLEVIERAAEHPKYGSHPGADGSSSMHPNANSSGSLKRSDEHYIGERETQLRRLVPKTGGPQFSNLPGSAWTRPSI